MKLNSQSPIPLYHQLADILLEQIRSGKYQPGSRILSEPKLAEQYGIGRPTARQATDVLVRKGFLIRRRGAGTFVRDSSDEVDLLSLGGTLSSFRQKGLQVETEIRIPIRKESVKADEENPFAGRYAYFFSRLNRVAKRPVLVENFFMDPETFPDMERHDLSGQALSRIVDEHYYMRPVGGKQNFRIFYPDDDLARSLDQTIKEPVLLVKRYLDFPGAENAIYSELVCRTDRFVFSQYIRSPL